jgi:glycerol kinase
VLETTALGAALLAGTAVGFYADAAAVADARRVERSFVPRMEEGARDRMRARWREAVERSKGWATAAGSSG